MVLALTLLAALIPPYLSLANATAELRELQTRVRTMTSTITVTRDSGTTVYHECTNYVRSDNGTISFTGRKGSDSAPEASYVLGHGTYIEVEVV